MSDDLVKRLRWADFGTETSERNLMIAAAVRIETQAARIAELEAALNEIKNKTTDGHPITCVADIWGITRAALTGGKS